MANIETRDLLDAGLHFGHQTKRWNPSMKRFIFGAKNGIYIIDLSKTMAQMKVSESFLCDTVAKGKNVLFVGTKKQAQEILKETAEKCGQPYVVNRWLGGMLTNNQTVRQSVQRMRELQKMRDDGVLEKISSKKEQSMLRRELEKLERNLTGIADMDRLPGALFVVDICREHLAIKEAQRLNIPVVALVDTNADPDQVEYPIPGNDDSLRSIRVVAEYLGESIKTAYDEYSRAAKERAEERKAKDAEEKAAAAAAKEERKAKEVEERKKREKVLEKMRKERASKKTKPVKEEAEEKPAEKTAGPVEEKPVEAEAPKAEEAVAETTETTKED